MESSINPPKRDDYDLLNDIDRPTIRVLIYTDDPEMVGEDGIFGISELRSQLAAHPPAFARIELSSVISRNSDASPNHHADHKIDDELSKHPDQPYHEVWFFGVHQANKPEYKLKFPGGGGPRSELEPDEIAALEDWMCVDQKDGSKGIGVLVSGDHADPPPDEQPISGPDKFCPPDIPHKRFLGLGRALGKRIPRAGLLRKWEGPPTHCVEDSFNTLFPPPDQMDPRPQRLILPRFDEYGNPSPAGDPHELFRGRGSDWISVLPDHQHEGAVIVPNKFPTEVWPRCHDTQPIPRVIAYGTDRRTGCRLNILAAYNGDAAGVGRIISDSSWHHYFNVNLKFLSARHLHMPAADQIGQFFSNLVVWLAPLAIRRAMARSMFIWLATHPLMMEEISSGPLNIGNLSLQLLRQVASDCEIHELLVAACPQTLRQRFETFNFSHEPKMSQLPTVEVLLGSIISKYFEAVGQKYDNVGFCDAQLGTIIHNGFTHAFLVNGMSAATFAYQSLFMLMSFQLDSISSEVLRTFERLESLRLAIQHRKEKQMNAYNEPLAFLITLDKGGAEIFTLTLEVDHSLCKPFEPMHLSICPLSGSLTSDSERYEVRGSLVRPHNAIYFEFPFRRVRMIMGGIQTEGGDIVTRFVAVAPDMDFLKNTKLSMDVPINPDEGDTGTGTGTQTLVSDEQTQSTSRTSK